MTHSHDCLRKTHKLIRNEVERERERDRGRRIEKGKILRIVSDSTDKVGRENTERDGYDR